MRDLSNKTGVSDRGARTPIAEKRLDGKILAEAIKPVLMDVGIANSLIVGLSLSDTQLRVALEHYKRLEEMLRVSGPHFANARREAAVKHNIVVRRINESREEAERRRAKAAAYDADLQELEV